MENKYNIFVKITWLNSLTLIIAFSLISGCQTIIDSREAWVNGKDGRSQKTLEKGYKAFYRGDYHHAANAFDAIKSTASKELSQKALFALTCTEIILADTLKARKKAIGRLSILTDSATITMNNDDLKLLDALLHHMVTRTPQERKVKPELDTLWTHQCQLQIQMQDEQLLRLNKKIKSLNKEIAVLKNKIRSIEEIDHKIEEKKNAPIHRKLF